MGSSCPSRGQRRERRVTVLREEFPGHHRRLSGHETDYTASRGPGDSCVTALSSGCGRWPWWWSERPSRQPLDSGDASRPLPEAPAPPSPTGVSRPGRGPGAVPGAGTARERDGHAPAFSGAAGWRGRTDGRRRRKGGGGRSLGSEPPRERRSRGWREPLRAAAQAGAWGGVCRAGTVSLATVRLSPSSPATFHANPFPRSRGSAPARR